MDLMCFFLFLPIGDARQALQTDDYVEKKGRLCRGSDQEKHLGGDTLMTLGCSFMK